MPQTHLLATPSIYYILYTCLLSRPAHLTFLKENGILGLEALNLIFLCLTGDDT